MNPIIAAGTLYMIYDTIEFEKRNLVNIKHFYNLFFFQLNKSAFAWNFTFEYNSSA